MIEETPLVECLVTLSEQPQDSSVAKLIPWLVQSLATNHDAFESSKLKICLILAAKNLLINKKQVAEFNIGNDRKLNFKAF